MIAPVLPRRRARATSMVVALLCALGRLVAAQTDGSVPSMSPSPRMPSWQYFQEIPVEPAPQARYHGVFLGKQVFDGARVDLADLRLRDATGEEIPYALRVLRGEDTLETLSARIFNRVRGETGVAELSIDLGANPPEHNEIEVEFSGGDAEYYRHAVLEGADTPGSWRQLAEARLLHLHLSRGDAQADVEHRKIDYPPSRFRYLRLRVHPDPTRDDGALEVGEVIVRHRVRREGEDVAMQVDRASREPVRTDEGPSSAWLIDLGGAKVPVSKVSVQVENTGFVRNWRLEAAGPRDESQGFGDPFSEVGRGVWRHRAGEPREPLVGTFNEVRAARLRLIVVDNENPPLVIRSVEVLAAAREVVFADRPELTGIVKLYFGNPDAGEPRYDFARNLPDDLRGQVARRDPGERQENPDWQPEPQPLGERWPWLIYVVLGTALAILLTVVVSLARAARVATQTAE